MILNILFGNPCRAGGSSLGLVQRGGGSLQQGGMGERCKLPHQGLGLHPSCFALFKSKYIAFASFRLSALLHLQHAVYIHNNVRIYQIYVILVLCSLPETKSLAIGVKSVASKTLFIYASNHEVIQPLLVHSGSQIALHSPQRRKGPLTHCRHH